MDLIDRQALLKQIEIDSDGEPGYYGDTWKFIDTIKNLPSATDNNVGTKLGTNLASLGTDLISRAAAQTELQLSARRYTVAHEAHGEGQVVWSESLISVSDAMDTLRKLPSAQPERTCVNCGRTANNGGWYADGGTRCPIEEHYALPKDGYCHLWEKRNVTDDDYPERKTDE